MSTDHLSIKLDDAKKAIGISGFKSDGLLKIALTDPASLNSSNISLYKQNKIKNSYRRLAVLGDTLLDAVLVNYLFTVDDNEDLTGESLDGARQNLLNKYSLSTVALELGLPKFCSSHASPHRKELHQEPRVWAEMFEALVGVIFIDQNHDFAKISTWLIDLFIAQSVNNYFCDETTITDREYYDMIGLEGIDLPDGLF